MTVPRWWPERVCWALSREYHEVPGGHVRIYRRRQLAARLRGSGLVLAPPHHHAHALHSPYWWLRCALGMSREEAVVARLYHRFLVYDLMRKPRWTRSLERALNPMLGKSVVLYAQRPEPRDISHRRMIETSLTRGDVSATVDAIAQVQRPDGSIPWYERGQADPWNHVEAAMALDVGGRHVEAWRAYRWLVDLQRPDGAWHAAYRDGTVIDATLDTNLCAYIATGLWLHLLCGAPDTEVRTGFACVERALAFVLSMQGDDGAVWWACDARGRPWRRGLVTGSSSIHLSLACATSACRRARRAPPRVGGRTPTRGRCTAGQPAQLQGQAALGHGLVLPRSVRGGLRR